MGTRSAAGALLALAAMACGPSFQAIYEGDQRFEHCYAFDDNPTASITDKVACWRDWMQHYTYGQTRNRVEYAAMRARALARVPSLPTDESMMEAAPGEVTTPGVSAPAPTSAFAPPPSMMASVDAGVRAAAPMPSVVFVAPPASVIAPPAASCQDDCSHGWHACREDADAGSPKSEACGKTYKACMKACFK